MSEPRRMVPSASMTWSSTTRTAVALGVALLLTVLALLAILPTGSMAVLPLVLASSELSPALALLAALWLLVARRLLAAQQGPRLLVTGLLVLAVLVAIRPLVEAGLVAGRADAELRALGVAPLPFGATLGALPAEPAVRHRLVHYAAADGSPLVMRLFDRADEEILARPIVVVIYGGAWRGGDPAQGGRFNDALARSGYLVAAIDYRHAPRFQFPIQLEDVRRSIALVRDSAAAWHGDASRIALLGRSSGGQLAELAAFKVGDRPVQGVVAIYAPWDLAEGYRDPPSPDPIGVRHVIRDFLGGTPAERRQVYRAASPASYVRAGLPPVLLLYGARDHLVKPDFNREAASALRSADVGVVAVEIPWSEHAFDLVPGGLGERLAWAVTERFLGAVLGNAVNGSR